MVKPDNTEPLMVFRLKGKVTAHGYPHADLDIPFNQLSAIHLQNNVVTNFLVF
jgi:hypothetical protein